MIRTYESRPVNSQLNLPYWPKYDHVILNTTAEQIRAKLRTHGSELPGLRSAVLMQQC